MLRPPASEMPGPRESTRDLRLERRRVVGVGGGIGPAM